MNRRGSHPAKSCLTFLTVAGALLLATGMSLKMASAQDTSESPTPKSQQDWSGPLGIAAKKPVYAGGGSASPFGEVGVITKKALSYYGYDVHLCTSCAGPLAARDMSLKQTRNMSLKEAGQQQSSDSNSATGHDVVPDLATGHDALLSRLLKCGQDAVPCNTEGLRSSTLPPLKNNLRLIAEVTTPTWFVVAVRRSLGITSLAQLKNRRNIWVYSGSGSAPVLNYYSLTQEVLQKNGGGFITGQGRERRAGADVWVGDLASLTHTEENRMWGEITQLNDLVFLQMDEPLLDKLVATGDYERVVLPVETFRGVDQDIQTVTRIGGTFVYVRDDAPDDFAYTVAKALYEHRDLFRKQQTIFYYDSEIVVKSVLPLHPGAAKFYREIGFLK
jgi:hypothetical protein